jgi:predicted short-subunit dehydrogenase-like oxidoreductase (DUF2520 family)
VPTLRVIGPGRAGTAMSRALHAAGWTVAPPVRRHDDATDAAEGVDLLLITTPDAAVARTAADVRPVATTVVAHCAGSLGLDVLRPHARRASIHPLVSIPSGDTNVTGAWFGINGDDLAGKVVADLGGLAVTIDDDQRAAYHAAACIASNHLVALLGQVERVAATVGVPLDAFLALARQSLDNVERVGAHAAQTGPVKRGDRETVERHRAALTPDELAAYDAMVDLAERLT